VEARDAKGDQHDARVRPPAAALVTCNDRDEAAETVQHREGGQQPKIHKNGVRPAVIEEEVVEHASAPEPAPRKDGVAASEQHSIREVCQRDRRRRTQHRKLHHEHVAVVHHQRPPAEHPAHGVVVPARDRDEYKRHDGGDQDTHRVAHLEEDERCHHNPGQHNIATPDKGRAATIRGERKVEEEQGKAPEGESRPTAVAAEVDLGIAITQFKALVVVIHTEKGGERDRSACEVEEHHSAWRYEVRLGDIPQEHRCHTNVVYYTPHHADNDGGNNCGHYGEAHNPVLPEYSKYESPMEGLCQELRTVLT
jgi:hypothetical protein